MKIIAGRANRELCEKIAKKLGVGLASCLIKDFDDGEIYTEILENVRGEDVFLIQPTSTPINKNIMELLITLDALKRASADRVTAVIPYFGYARQDRKTGPRTPISAKLAANIIAKAGANRVLTIDLHAAQIQGFFDIPTDNLFAIPVFVKDIIAKYSGSDVMIISPDIGGVQRARSLANRLNTDIAVIDKRRPKQGLSEVVNIIGDPAGRNCIIIDDIIDSAGTLCNAALAIKNAGAKSISAYISHGIMSGNAKMNIANSCLTELVLTDSVQAPAFAKVSEKIRYISLDSLLSEAIRRIAKNQSVSILFE